MKAFLFRSIAGIAIGCFAAFGAHAENYPARPIRLIVPFTPGGGTDQLARAVATSLSETLKWTVVVDNRAGAGGTIGIAEAARMPATGYEMVMGQKDNLVVAPWLYKNLNYDATRDLAPVAHVAYTPIVLVTAANSPYKTLADVLAAARQRPDAVTYGSSGAGTTPHLAMEIFSKAAQVKLRHIPYKGANPAMLDVLAGNVDLMTSSVPSLLGQIRSGKLRALAVTSNKRSSSLPDVPTVAEQGFKDFDVRTWYGLFMPAGTPRDIVAKVNAELNTLLSAPKLRDAILSQGAEPEAMTPEKLGQMLRTELPQWKTIVEESGAKVD